jgi:hypothetical protein
MGKRMSRAAVFFDEASFERFVSELYGHLGCPLRV